MYFRDISSRNRLNGSVFPVNGSVRHRQSGLRSSMTSTPLLMIARSVCLMLLITLTVTAGSEAQIRGLAFFDTEAVITCPVDAAKPTPPDFQSITCAKGSVLDADPQNTLIWVRTVVTLDATRGPNGEPLSVYVSGKMSSDVYLNGTFIGRNGQPGANRAAEQPGLMDAELYPPQTLFRVGENEVILKASSHHGLLHLSRPLHMVGIAPTGAFGKSIIRAVGLSLLTLGLFIVGALYFGVMAALGENRARFAVLSAICGFAALQLISETLRGLTDYAYPVHDVRLIAISAFSAAFALSVAFHVFRTFAHAYAMKAVLVLAALDAIAMFVIESMDYTALAGMTLPLLACLLATAVWTYQGRRRAFIYFVALLSFIGCIFVFRGLFLDTVFFLLVAIFLMLLFVEQAVALTNEAKERRKEEARANTLEQTLAALGEKTETQYIQVKSAGQMVRIATSQIIHCQGAGGYSELFLESGKSLLHAETLNELEERLPGTFLRVHRSHLINLMFVSGLTRDPAGTGSLHLGENVSVPVSRRIMPKVRLALA